MNSFRWSKAYNWDPFHQQAAEPPRQSGVLTLWWEDTFTNRDHLLIKGPCEASKGLDRPKLPKMASF